MSTVFYGFHIPLHRFWPMIDGLRAWALKEHPLLAAIKPPEELAELAWQRHLEGAEPDGVKFFDDMAKIRQLADSPDFSWRLQVFRGPAWAFPEICIFRVLERQFAIFNELSKDRRRPMTKRVASGLVPVHYDTRTDVPRSHKKNAKFADWADVCINRGDYLIYNLVDGFLVERECMKAHMKAGEIYRTRLEKEHG